MRFLATALPLLLKELQEQAVRKRTVVMRVVVAATAYFIFVIAFSEQFSNHRGSVLGRGDDIFSLVAGMQFLAAFGILPLLLAGSIAHEKETDTLQLLVVSRMSAWSILWQMLLARLIPFFGYLSLTFPLLGIAYSIGGVEANQILSLAYLIGLTSLNVAALSIFVSTIAVTTVSAFIGVFVLGGVFYLGPAILVEMFELYALRKTAASFFPISLYSEYYRNGVWPMVAASWHMWLTTIGFLLLARFFFYRRAFVRGTGLLRRVFSRVDRITNAANRQLGGIRFGGKGAGVPGDDRPVRWRELQRRGLDRSNHTVRLSLFLLVPAIGGGVIALRLDTRFTGELLSAVILFYWGLVALIVTTVSANVVVSERTGQTLDVLLTTPIPSTQIIRDKLAPVFRWIMIATIGFLVLYAMSDWTRGRAPIGRSGPLPSSYYIVLSLGLVWIYLPMLAWVAMAIGLRSKTRVRATVTALVVVALWQFLPLVATWMITVVASSRSMDTLFLVMLGSPMMSLAYLEFYRDGIGVWGSQPWVPFAVTFVWHLFVLRAARRWCLSRAAHRLGRVWITGSQ